MVNWVMLPFMNQIWEHMLSLGVPNRTGRPRTMFVDLCDPEKRTKEDIRAAMQLLTRFQKHVDVVLGLNLSEAGQIAEVLGHEVGGEPELVIAGTAAEIRQRLGISCVVVHPRRGAAAAADKGVASFAGPFVHEPRISTGAGDHFNAGFALGRVLGMGLEECLCTGVATSGYYVRTAESPTAQQLADFIEKLPPPQ
jgi:sugar/nucleoside kinase (ribokinase family)